MIQTYTINQLTVRYDPEIFSREEILKLIDKAKEVKPNFYAITFRLDGDKVACDYSERAVPFERIRRITGYLVGTTDRWNDAKRAEESERVKHGVEDYS